MLAGLPISENYLCRSRGDRVIKRILHNGFIMVSGKKKKMKFSFSQLLTAFHGFSGGMFSHLLPPGMLSFVVFLADSHFHRRDQFELPVLNASEKAFFSCTSARGGQPHATRN
jgi:hypothetical protein